MPSPACPHASFSLFWGFLNRREKLRDCLPRRRPGCLTDLDIPPPAPLQGAAALGTESLRGGAQSVHRASSTAPFLGLTGGSRNAAMCSNGPLSLEAWRTPTLRGSPKPRRAGQGQRGTKAIFKSKGAAGSPSDIFFKTCIYLLNNVC